MPRPLRARAGTADARQALCDLGTGFDVTPLTRSETIGPALREATSDFTRLIFATSATTPTRFEKAVSRPLIRPGQGWQSACVKCSAKPRMRGRAFGCRFSRSVPRSPAPPAHQG